MARKARHVITFCAQRDRYIDGTDEPLRSTFSLFYLTTHGINCIVGSVVTMYQPRYESRAKPGLDYSLLTRWCEAFMLTSSDRPVFDTKRNRAINETWCQFSLSWQVLACPRKLWRQMLRKQAELSLYLKRKTQGGCQSHYPG